MRQLFSHIACGILLTAFYGCQQPDSLKISGSSTVLPVISKAAEQYRSEHPDLQLIINGGGSGVGIKMVAEGKVDIGMASRTLTKSEKKEYPNTRFQLHPIGIDAVVPVVSSEIYQAGIQQVTLDTLTAIYKGKINNWKALGGPDREIIAVDKEKTRGTRHVFMQALTNDPQAKAPGADLVIGSNNEEQTTIAQSDAALGMLSFAWISEKVKGLALRLKDGTRIPPSRTVIQQHEYHITRKLYLVTTGLPKGEVKEFLDFVKSVEGQKIVKETGYVPLHP